MPFEFRRIHRVEFAETDMAGIVHFSQFFRYMEETEHAFFRSLGASIHAEVEGRMIGWPRVHASCDYLRPLRFEEEVEVQLLVREKREKSLSYSFHFRKVSEPETEIARGALTAVCAALDEKTGKMRAIPIPFHIADQVQVAPEGL